MARLLLAQTEEPRTPGAKESWGERGSMAPWLLARGGPEEARSQGGKESKESWAAWLLGSVVLGPERAGGAKDVKWYSIYHI